MTNATNPHSRTWPKKTLTINKCELCPHHNFDDSERPERWGKHWCDHPKLNSELENKGGKIPEECPLP